MTDPFDEAKRALEDVPANDVWAEAERRSRSGAVVPLAPITRRVRRPGRWLAAAAAAIVAVGTVAVLASDDDAPVDTVPGGSTSGAAGAEDVTTYQADGACKLGVRGEPLPEPSTTAFTSPDGTTGTMLVGHLNEVQQYAVHVPGQVVIDLVGERVEDVQLERGTAQLWFQQVPNDSVQVRWFPGGQDACESFTVSVESGTEDENRHAAVDLAERVLVGAELEAATAPHPTPGANPLPYGIWPMTAPESMLGYAPEFTGSHREIAAQFAFQVLGWNDALIADQEPSGDGQGGSVFVVTSETTGGEVEIRVRDGDAPGRSIVYAVNTLARLADPDATLGISVQGETATVSVSPIPEGTTAIARFTYGEAMDEGPVREDPITIIGRDPGVPGAVVVLFIDEEMHVVGAVGTALPAGDFAAS